MSDPHTVTAHCLSADGGGCPAGLCVPSHWLRHLAAFSSPSESRSPGMEPGVEEIISQTLNLLGLSVSTFSKRL